MSVKSKIFLSFSVLAFLFLLNGVVSIVTLNGNKRLAEHMVEVEMPSSDALDSLTLMVVESKMYSTNWVFLRYNEEDKQSLRLIEDKKYQLLKKQLLSFERRWENAGWADSLQHVLVGFEELLRIDRRIMQSLKSFGDYDDPVLKLEAEQLVEDQVLPRTAMLTRSLDSLNEAIKKAGQEASDKRMQASIALRTQIIALGICICLAGLFLSLYMTRLIIQPINRMRTIIHDLGRGVIRPIETKRQEDEIGSMIRSVNYLSSNLRATAEFARNIGARNFSALFQPLSSEDTLGKALIAMRDNLRESEEELTAATVDLHKKDQILEAVALATHELVSNTDFDKAIGRSIGLLGQRIAVDIVNVFKVEREGTNDWYADQIVRWTRRNGEIEYNHKDYQHLASFSLVIESLARGESSFSATRTVGDLKVRAYLEERGIKTATAIPIFVAGEFWGLVSLNDCHEEREWTTTEFSLLRSFAASLGSAIQRLQTEQQLIIARDKAEAASMAKSEFMANMSHELRTPMNAIIGFTDLVLTTEMQKTQRDYLKNVRKGAYNLLNIINDILDFSKIEAGKLALEEVPFSLFNLVEDTVDMMSIKAEEKRLELICDIDRGLPSSFVGDEIRIRQILINLLGNAIKFTEKGEVAVSVRCRNDGVHRGDKVAVDIAIGDTGIGIAPEKLGPIFESFTQADNSTTRKYGGTGLGLSISKRLATMMGGDLRAESVPEQGSTFTLELQLAVANHSPSITFADRPVLRHVLVVDDNYTNCHLMQGIFAHLGIPCKISLSGYEALAEVTQSMDDGEPFDLIITDHQMPSMDGISLVKRIKKTIDGRMEPFILMLSSLEKTVYQHEAERIGINKFLSKPVKLHELEALLGGIFKDGGSRGKETTKAAGLVNFGQVKKVLVVEDEPINMLLISEILGKMGLDVIQASNGREAIGTLADNDICLIFMDVNMPDIDGYSATRIIRGRQDQKRNVPIIALTADALPEDKEKCLSSGMNDYLAKPFRLEELQTVLQHYLVN